MNLFGGPAADLRAAMKQNFQQANDPGFMDFDPRVANRTDGERQSDTLQQREVNVDVEPLSLV